MAQGAAIEVARVPGGQEAGGDFWAGLAERIARESGDAPALWDGIKERADLALYRPERIPDVVTAEVPSAQGTMTILKNPTKHTYLRLTPEDRFIWDQMDGRRTVKDIVVGYFLKYKSFAFARVASLVEELRKSNMLTDPPADVYASVSREIAKTEGSYQLQRMRELFLQKQFAFERMDGFITAVYRGLLWPLFTAPGKLVMLLVGLLGMACYAWVFKTGHYSVFEAGGSYSLGMLSYLAISAAVIAVHEGGHAFATKSYGREVARGGLVLYFGSPCFFADTSDIWLEPKNRRIAVSWAGPYAEFILAGLLSIVMVAFPHNAANNVLFKLAFFSYLSVFMNMNPLLELDGYFILVDLLEIPMLRKKSLTFVREKLWPRLRAPEKFTREEKIFTVFGLLAGAWSAAVIALSFYVYNLQIRSFIKGLVSGKDPLAIVISVVAFLVFLGPATVGLLSMVLTTAQSVLRAVYHSPFWDRARNVALALALTAVGAAAAPALLARFAHLPPRALEAAGPVAQFALLGVGCALLARILSAVAGSSLVPAYRLLFATLAALLASRALELVQVARPALPLDAAAHLIERASALPLLGFAAALFALYATPGASALERWALPAVPTLAVAALAPSPALALPPFALALAGTLLLPDATVHRRSDLGFAAVGTLLGIGALAAAYTVEARASEVDALETLAVGLLSLSPVLMLRVLTRFGYRRTRTEARLHSSDRERLQSAFREILRVLFRFVEELFGDRTADRLRDQVNLESIAAGWGITLRRDAVVLSGGDDVGVVALGARYRRALHALTGEIAMLTGRPFVERALRGAYDQLHWEERETASGFLFTDTDWGRELSREFAREKRKSVNLVASLPLFAGLSSAERESLTALLREQRFAPGEAIVRQGEEGDSMYVLAQGTAEVSVTDAEGRVVHSVQLGRGEFFGEVAVLEGVPRTATVRAVEHVRALVLGREALQGALRERVEMEKKLRQSFRHYDFLKSLPLFREMEPQQFGELAGEVEERSAQAGEVLVRKGEPGVGFFMIDAGRAEVVGRNEQGSERVVAELDEGEYFGEISLLTDQPATATVRARGEMSLYVIRREAFQRLLGRRLFTSKDLDRLASRRMQHLQRRMAMP